MHATSGVVLVMDHPLRTEELPTVFEHRLEPSHTRSSVFVLAHTVTACFTAPTPHLVPEAWRILRAACRGKEFIHAWVAEFACRSVAEYPGVSGWIWSLCSGEPIPRDRRTVAEPCSACCAADSAALLGTLRWMIQSPCSTMVSLLKQADQILQTHRCKALVAFHHSPHKNR